VKAAARVCSLERALQIRHWGRDRRMDEMVLPYFERTEPYQNPFLDRRNALDRAQFRPVVDEFYGLHSWDTARGWPTREHLRELDMEHVYQPMIEGAASIEMAACRDVSE
jgi:aldehyde:ferredoxin oxidoreductase